MMKEIKELLDKLKDDNWYDELDLTGDKWIELKQTETKQLLDYITNLQQDITNYVKITLYDRKEIDRLQQENEKLKEENTTLIKNQINSNSEHFRIIKENKRKIDNLRNQVKVLHESIIKSAKNTNKSIELTEIYKSRCEKALHLIKHNDIYDYRVFEEKLENILNGSDEK